MPNYTPQIQLLNGSWLGNTQIFATKLEAECAAFYMMDGFMEAIDYRAVESVEPVNSVIATPLHKLDVPQ